MNMLFIWEDKVIAMANVTLNQHNRIWPMWSNRFYKDFDGKFYKTIKVFNYKE